MHCALARGRHLFEPLGMNDTGVSSVAALQTRASSVCHKATYPQAWGWATPAGGLYSSARDLALLLTQLVDSPAGGLTSRRLLNEQTRHLMLQPNLMLQGAQFTGPGAWEGRFVRDFQVFGKAGSVAGYTAYVAVVPQLRLSWAFVRNGDAPAGVRHTPDDLASGVVTSLGRLLPALNASLVASEMPPNATYPRSLAMGAIVGTYCGQNPGLPGFIPGERESRSSDPAPIAVPLPLGGMCAAVRTKLMNAFGSMCGTGGIKLSISPAGTLIAFSRARQIYAGLQFVEQSRAPADASSPDATAYRFRTAITQELWWDYANGLPPLPFPSSCTDMWASGMISEIFELLVFDAPITPQPGVVINALLRTNTYAPWTAPWYQVIVNGAPICSAD